MEHFWRKAVSLLLIAVMACVSTIAWADQAKRTSEESGVIEKAISINANVLASLGYTLEELRADTDKQKMAGVAMALPVADYYGYNEQLKDQNLWSIQTGFVKNQSYYQTLLMLLEYSGSSTIKVYLIQWDPGKPNLTFAYYGTYKEYIQSTLLLSWDEHQIYYMHSLQEQLAEYARIEDALLHPATPVPTATPIPDLEDPTSDDLYEDPTGYYQIEGNTAVFDTPLKAAATVTIPDTITVGGVIYKVTGIEAYAFENNKKLKTVKQAKNITSIGESAFEGCAKLKTVQGGAKLTTIKAYAFENCKALNTLPTFAKLKTIGTSAFQVCVKQTKVTLGASVKTIGKNAFYGCKKLKTITIKSTKLTSSSVKANAFKGIYKKAVFKCPKAKKAAYKKLFLKKGVPTTATFK